MKSNQQNYLQKFTRNLAKKIIYRKFTGNLQEMNKIVTYKEDSSLLLDSDVLWW